MAESLNLLSTKLVTGGDVTDKKSRLAYPENLFENYTDYVKFDFYKYNGPFSGDGGGETIDTEGAPTKDLQIYNQSNGKQYKKYPGTKTILMYMPEDISTGYAAEWGGKNFSNVGMNALRMGGNALAGDGGATVDAFVNSIKTGAGALPSTAAQGLATGISAIGNDSISTNDVLQGALGVILNPNTELMFSGFKPRTFSLKYKMSARNEPEAKMIAQIIGTFKKVTLPKFGKEAGGALDASKNTKDFLDTLGFDTGNEDTRSNANYIGVPGLCNVQFMKGTKLHEHLPQYKVCAITDVSINYTPDGTYNTYDGGRPVAVELSLAFTETKLVYSDDINIDGLSY